MIWAVVLAAGRSRRMGTQKLLLPWGSQTVIGRVVSEVLNSAVSGVSVVVGCGGSDVADSLRGSRITLITNPMSDSDMLASVRCGLRTLPEACEGVLVVLGDQPAIQSRLIDDMVGAFRVSGKTIVVPVHQGRHGHPLLFSAGHVDEVLTQHDTTGLRGLLQAHADEVAELKVNSAGPLMDIDVPEDYERELASWMAGQHRRELA